MLFCAAAFALYLGTFAWATPAILWEGRASFKYTETDIDESFGPYFRYVAASIIWPISYMKKSQHGEGDAESQSRKCVQFPAASSHSRAACLSVSSLHSTSAFWATPSTQRRYGPYPTSPSVSSSTIRLFSPPEAARRSSASAAARSSRRHPRTETAPRSMRCSRAASRRSTSRYTRTLNDR